MAMAALKETAIGARVVEWLRGYGYDVYQEVLYGGHAADIVATRGSLLVVVECKTTMSLDVIEQAHNWTDLANFVWCAVPCPHNGGRRFAYSVARHFGAGVLEVDAHRVYDDHYVLERVGAPFRRNVDSDKLRAVLHEQHKTALPAGSNGKGRWSPFRQTSETVLRYVEAHPGATLSDVIKNSAHHYASTASARGSLTRWIEAGKIQGIVIRRDGRKVTVHPK